MFLGLLSERQRHAFAIVARFITRADGTVLDEERWYLHILEKEIGAPPPPPGDEGEIEDALALFDNPLSRNILLIESLAVALSDGRFDPREEEAISLIARRLGMRPEKVERFRIYAERIVKLVDEGEDLIATR